MNVRLLLYGVLLSCIFAAGCETTQPPQEYVSTQITQAYEKKRNMSETEAVQVLQRYLMNEASSPGYFEQNLFSIDTNGYVRTSSSRQTDATHSQLTGQYLYTTESYHFNHLTKHLMFADVTRIEITARTRTFVAVELSSIKADGRGSDFIYLTQSKFKPLGQQTEELLSALLTLCPNVK